MKSHSTFRSDRRHVPGRGGGILAAVFVATAVVALAVVPLIMGRQAAEAQREAAEVLDPARLRATELSFVQARQMSLFQSYLLGGDPRFQRLYEATFEQEQEIYRRLRNLVEGMDLEVREALTDLSNTSDVWHVRHRAAFDTAQSVRRQMLADLDEEQARYDRLQQATLRFEETLRREVDAGHAQIRSLRALQNRITLGLVLLALGATFVVGVIGWQLRTLTAEAESRRRDAVRARRENEAIVEATADGVVGIDLEGRCISVNRHGLEMLGFTERELVGRDVHATLHHTRPDGVPRPRARCRIVEAVSRGGSARSREDDVLWRKDGTPLPVQWSLRPLVDGLEVRGGVLTFTDMTEIRQKESALRRAVRVREEVLSVVSHDLRNPLGVVAGAADLMLDLPLDEAERTKQATIIRRSAHRMRRLIEDLLDVSRIEEGALVVRPTAEDVSDALEEAREFFAPQADEVGVRLRIAVGEGTPQVLADRDRLQQALANLLTNALRFTPAGGAITLSASADGDRRVVIDVADTGPGVPPEAMAHIFDRFWQASRHDRTGAGLGLAIVRGIAEAHGGSVDVLGTEGGGATFRLILPATSEPARTEELV